MGNLIFGKTTIQGRKFDKIQLQTSKAGVPRPIIFGRVKPVVGNIIATTPPKIVKKKEKQKGGKGGGSTEVVNEEVYRTYAIRICEGPITGICKVWRNNELVYDRDSNDPTQIDNNQAFLQLAEFFLGGFQQMPSAVLQAAFGIHNVPAYRGTCYLVIDNENLTSTGGAIPQYAFEVERAEGTLVTSRPYALEASDTLSIQAAAKEIRQRPASEVLEILPSVTAISLVQSVILSEYSPAAETLACASSVTSINLQQILIRSEYSPAAESLHLQPSVTTIQLKRVVGYLDHNSGAESLGVRTSVNAIHLEEI
ncbi:hypothetical protein [uncultured Microbulbifer sp.]|uniref:hypothetical protein n=1 Tax=uncultured Microbulbifer sp. TaxID=348147 RepID=UPI002631477C|nr:hypothetical protein [uncultured Microbulbifer sp.]